MQAKTLPVIELAQCFKRSLQYSLESRKTASGVGWSQRITNEYRQHQLASLISSNSLMACSYSGGSAFSSDSKTSQKAWWTMCLTRPAKLWEWNESLFFYISTIFPNYKRNMHIVEILGNAEKQRIKNILHNKDFHTLKKKLMKIPSWYLKNNKYSDFPSCSPKYSHKSSFKSQDPIKVHTFHCDHCIFEFLSFFSVCFFLI